MSICKSANFADLNAAWTIHVPFGFCFLTHCAMLSSKSSCSFQSLLTAPWFCTRAWLDRCVLTARSVSGGMVRLALVDKKRPGPSDKSEALSLPE